MQSATEHVKLVCLVPHGNVTSLLEVERRYFSRGIQTYFPVFFPLYIDKIDDYSTEQNFLRIVDFFSKMKSVQISTLQCNENRLFRNLILDTELEYPFTNTDYYFSKYMNESELLFRIGCFLYGSEQKIEEKPSCLFAQNIDLRVFKVIVVSFQISKTTNNNYTFEWIIEKEKWIKKT